MKKTVYNDQCPTPEVVGDLFDGTLDFKSEDYRHIKHCNKCQKILAAYAELDQYIKKNAQINNVEPLVQSIRKNVWQIIEEKPAKLNLFDLMLRTAAGLVIAGGVTYLIVSQYFMSAKIEKSVSINSQLTSSGNQIKAQTFPYYTGSEYQQLPGSNSDGIPVRSLIGANYGNKFSPVFISEKDAPGSAPASIGTNVKQVWMTNDIKSSSNKLHLALERVGIADKNIFLVNKNGLMQLQMVMTKSQLVNFVKNCEQSGFELMSPQAPQPEQNEFLGNANDPVYYSMEILSDKQK